LLPREFESHPFRQFLSPRSFAAVRHRVWQGYRTEMIGSAGIALFLFGNKREGEEILPSDGIRQEYDIALEQGLVVLPIGATGSISEQLATQLLSSPPDTLSPATRDALKSFSKPVNDLMTLINPIVELIRKLKEGL
jgi:hypothetical protein